MSHAFHSSGIVDDDGKMIYAGEAAGYVLSFPYWRLLCWRHHCVFRYGIDPQILQARVTRVSITANC